MNCSVASSWNFLLNFLFIIVLNKMEFEIFFGFHWFQFVYNFSEFS